MLIHVLPHPLQKVDGKPKIWSGWFTCISKKSFPYVLCDLVYCCPEPWGRHQSKKTNFSQFFNFFSIKLQSSRELGTASTSAPVWYFRFYDIFSVNTFCAFINWEKLKSFYDPIKPGDRIVFMCPIMVIRKIPITIYL